ncbi:MAG: hypothetical protein H7221_01110 [Flavobacterium sp.]|nr:hypothetical protein [Flavobacterium sp.]
MASTSETGHTKNTSNLETLITYCTGFGTNYAPSNTDITIAELTTFHTDCKNALKLVKTTQAPFENVEGQRKTLYKPLKPLSTKVFAAVKSAGLPQSVIDDADTINRKIQGRSSKNKQTPVEGETPSDGTSTAQQSYDMQLDYLEKQIELLAIQPKYKPNETPLKIITLNTYKTQLDTINKAVKTNYTPYKNAMIARDKKLYSSETGLIDRTKSVKNYIKSVFGTSSPEYKLISALKFKAPKK